MSIRAAAFCCLWSFRTINIISNHHTEPPLLCLENRPHLNKLDLTSYILFNSPCKETTEYWPETLPQQRNWEILIWNSMERILESRQRFYHSMIDPLLWQYKRMLTGYWVSMLLSRKVSPKFDRRWPPVSECLTVTCFVDHWSGIVGIDFQYMYIVWIECQLISRNWQAKQHNLNAMLPMPSHIMDCELKRRVLLVVWFANDQ